MTKDSKENIRHELEDMKERYDKAILKMNIRKELKDLADKRIEELEKEDKEKDITIEFLSLLVKKLLKGTKPHIEAGESCDELPDSGRDMVIEMSEKLTDMLMN